MTRLYFIGASILILLLAPLTTYSSGFFSSPKFLQSGSAAAPSLTFKSDQDTGFYLQGTADMRAVVGGSATLVYEAADLTSLVDHTISAAIKYQTTSVELVSDNQSVTASSKSSITLTSDNATAANRTFTLSAGEAGQELILIWNDTDEGQLEDTGTTLLTANWEPTNIGQTLRLINDGTNWIELHRADPT